MLGEIYQSQPGRAEKLKEVVLELDGRQARPSPGRRDLAARRPAGVQVRGIDSISDAERWAGADVLVAGAETEQPEEGEYSHADLIGCVLWDREASAWSRFVRVEDYGGAPLLEVKAEDGREILIPFARSICKEIDVAAKTIRVELPEGCWSNSEVSRPDDFPGFFPGPFEHGVSQEGARGRADRDPGARLADLDARPASDGG